MADRRIEFGERFTTPTAAPSSSLLTVKNKDGTKKEHKGTRGFAMDFETDIHPIRAFAFGCLELGSIATFVGALWVWADVIGRV